jgi:hypothetical protein
MLLAHQSFSPGLHPRKLVEFDVYDIWRLFILKRKNREKAQKEFRKKVFVHISHAAIFVLHKC